MKTITCEFWAVNGDSVRNIDVSLFDSSFPNRNPSGPDDKMGVIHVSATNVHFNRYRLPIVEVGNYKNRRSFHVKLRSKKTRN